MRKIIFTIALIFSVLFLLGCTQTPQLCGDMICSPGEENTCPTDCASQISGDVTVRIYGGGYGEDLVLEYSSYENVNVNLAESVSSRLGSNWGSDTYSNLNFSYNQNNFVQKPIPENREIILTNLKQGEYYFYARSENYDYSTQGVKVVISEDKDYDVQLEMKPSNPALRVKGYDDQWNLLTGPATVTVYEVSEYYDKYGTGDWVQNEWKVNSYYFGEKEEINALFWLWPTGYDMKNERNNYFKVVVDKEEYGSGTLEHVGLYEKYTEMSAIVYGEYVEDPTGSIKINIEPKDGLTDSDLEIFVGQNITLCPVNYYAGDCLYSEISNDLIAAFYDIPVGEYYAYGIWEHIENYGEDRIDMPVSIQSTTIINEEGGTYGTLYANLGYYNMLGVMDENSFIDSSQIAVHNMCVYYTETGEEYCHDYEGLSWTEFLVNNPYSLIMYDYDGSNRYNNIYYNMNLIDLRQDGGVESEFDLNFSFVKGYKEFYVVIPSITDSNI
jgi:hypothetical protein